MTDEFKLLLPQEIEKHPGSSEVKAFLSNRLQPIRKNSPVLIPEISGNPNFIQNLFSINKSRQCVRSLENAASILKAEDKGLNQLKVKSNLQGKRVSRLLIVSNDGSERFYRQIEILMKKHSPRLMVIKLTMDSNRLGELLYGPDEIVRSILVIHKNAVSRILLGMINSRSK